MLHNTRYWPCLKNGKEKLILGCMPLLYLWAFQRPLWYNKPWLMLVKFKAYEFWTSSLNLRYSYLKNRKQKVQISNKFILERNVIAGVPQESVDRPLLFNLFINDLVLFIQYTHDSNLFVIGKNKEDIKRFTFVRPWDSE